MVWVFGARARMLAEDMQKRGLTAKYGKTFRREDGVRLPEIAGTGRQGRPLAVVHAVSAGRSLADVGEWFFEVSDQLGDDGIYIVLTADEISLEAATLLAQCCQWQVRREEDSRG